MNIIEAVKLLKNMNYDGLKDHEEYIMRRSSYPEQIIILSYSTEDDRQERYITCYKLNKLNVILQREKFSPTTKDFETEDWVVSKVCWENAVARETEIIFDFPDSEKKDD